MLAAVTDNHTIIFFAMYIGAQGHSTAQRLSAIPKTGRHEKGLKKMQRSHCSPTPLAECEGVLANETERS